MSVATKLTSDLASDSKLVTPSRVSSSRPFTLEQELTPFGKWTSAPIWVPPRELSEVFAKSMLDRHGLLASKCMCWNGVVEQHRSSFQQVREIEMHHASIRLPKGKLFVSVTEQDRFDEIEDTVPACVRTRLEEFLAGPGKRPGVKVYYLKPLCVEMGDELIFTTRESIDAAIALVQQEVFSRYRRLYLSHRPVRALKSAVNFGLSIPQKVVEDYQQRKLKALNAYQARLEFSRRKLALRASETHRSFRTDGCTFDEMLNLTNPLERNDVIERYGIEKQLSQAERRRLQMAAMQTLPWFVALSLAASYVTTVAASVATFAPPLLVCDPAFVAEMPGSKGTVLKIGHFDEIRGVTHIEI